MRYAKLITSVTTNMDYCFAGPIRDAEACELYISDGDVVGDKYPADPFSVKVHFDPDFAGVQLPSLIGNTRSLLMLHRSVVAAFEERANLGPHEVFPFSLVNHKGRVHSKDYVFLNPLGMHDIAAPASDFIRYPDGTIYGCRKWALFAAKVRDLPDILRPAPVATHYLVSERLMELVAAEGFTNFEYEPVHLV